MPQNFRSRLVLSNLAITLFGLLVIVFVFTNVLAQRSKNEKKQGLASDSRLVASQVEFLYKHHGSRADLQELVNNTSRALQVRVIVVSPRGSIVYDSQRATPFFTGAWHPLDPKALRAARNARTQLQNLYVFQSPIRGTVRRNGGAVQLVASVSAVQPTLGALRDVILLVLGTALLVWLVIGWYFTYSISRPLLTITDATARMARGDYDARVPPTGHGEIARLAASFNDMAEKVQTSNRTLKDFLANISHDLRTPLTMIAGFSQALLDGTAGEGEVEESAHVIHDEAGKMQRMVSDLLQLTQLESGLMTFQRVPVQTQPFVQQVIDRVVRARGDSPIATIRNRVPAGLPLIEVDHEQMERALSNLLENALRYTPPQGSVTVRAEQVGKGWVQISVTDTGAGIPQQDLPRVFERFYRTDKSRDRRQGNSGLGLAIVRQIVEGHGGSVGVESQIGRGTTFWFTVPQQRAGQPTSESRQATDVVRGQPATR